MSVMHKEPRTLYGLWWRGASEEAGSVSVSQTIQSFLSYHDHTLDTFYSIMIEDEDNSFSCFVGSPIDLEGFETHELPSGDYYVEAVEDPQSLQDMYASIIGGIYDGSLDITPKPLGNSTSLLPCKIEGYHVADDTYTIHSLEIPVIQ